MTFEIVRIVLDFIVGGGFCVMILKFATLRSDVKKASEEAAQLALDNETKAMATFQEFIVDPLKKEINGLRKNIRNFEKAMSKINDCSLSDRCPVRNELSKSSTDGGANNES